MNIRNSIVLTFNQNKYFIYRFMCCDAMCWISDQNMINHPLVMRLETPSHTNNFQFHSADTGSLDDEDDVLEEMRQSLCCVSCVDKNWDCLFVYVWLSVAEVFVESHFILSPDIFDWCLGWQFLCCQLYSEDSEIQQFKCFVANIFALK